MSPVATRPVLSAVLAILVVALAAFPARAQVVTRGDLADTQAEVDQAEAEVAVLEGAVRDAEEEIIRIEESRARLESRSESSAAGAVELAESLTVRVVRMYMAAGSSRVLVGEVEDVSTRLAYLGAIADGDRDALTRLQFAAEDFGMLAEEAESELSGLERTVSGLREELAEAERLLEDVRERHRSLAEEWERQEEQRRAAAEAELRREEEELAASASTTTTTTIAGGSPPVTTAPNFEYDPTGGVEQWRPLVVEVFARWGLDRAKCATRSGIEFCVGPQVENALRVMHCESRGVPYAENPRSGTAGLFQNHPDYWTARVARIRSLGFEPGMPADASIWNPEYNVAGAALLVWESRETLLGNRGGGGVSPAQWPEFNHESFNAYGYGYSNWGEGPEPWGHWVACGAVTSAYPQGQGLYDPAWVHPWAG